MEDQHTPSTISTDYQMDRPSSNSQPGEKYPSIIIRLYSSHHLDKCEPSVMSLMNDSNAFAAISQVNVRMDLI